MASDELTQNIFLIAYNQTALDNHPRVLGLSSTRDKNNLLVPFGHNAKYVSKGATVIFYITGEGLLKGIFKVTSERLQKSDPLFVKEKNWANDFQFAIEENTEAIKTSPFKPLILKLHLFEHLKNPLKDYRMAIGGVNYVRIIDEEDMQVIANSLGLKLKSLKENDHQMISEDEIIAHKYGSGGEGQEHKDLKNAIAKNPRLIGFEPEQVEKVFVEKTFLSNDTVDILFELKGGSFAVVEVETYDPVPGCHQALKYKVLQCAEMGENITSKNVDAIVAARVFPPKAIDFCKKYGIKPILIKSKKL